MNKFLLRLVGAASLLLLVMPTVSGDEGVVIQKQAGCEFFVTKVNADYAVLEWNAGYEPKTGDRLEGKFAVGYMGHLEDVGTGGKVKVWYENYPVSKEEATRLYARYVKSSCRQ